MSNSTLGEEEFVFFQNSQTYIHLYNGLVSYFLMWYLPGVISIGFLGSAFCLFFLLRSYLFSPTLQLWLISICVGDFLILVMEGIWMFLKVWFQLDIRDLNDVMCILHTSVSNYSLYWSAYMQGLLSIQRCYLVLRPLKVKSECMSFNRLIFYQALISVLLVVPILPYPIYWRVIKEDCDPVNDRIFRLTTLCDFIFWGFIPSTIMITCTTIICQNLWRRRKFLGEAAVSRNTSEYSIMKPQYKRNRSVTYTHPPHLRRKITDPALNVTLSSSCSNHDHKRRSNFSDGNNQVTPVLICMNFVYVASVCPLVIYFLCLNFIFTHMDRNLHKFIYYFFRSLCFLNTCTNWIFYCVSGRTFRERTKQLLTSICLSSNPSSIVTDGGFVVVKYARRRSTGISHSVRLHRTSEKANLP